MPNNYSYTNPYTAEIGSQTTTVNTNLPIGSTPFTTYPVSANTPDIPPTTPNNIENYNKVYTNIESAGGNFLSNLGSVVAQGAASLVNPTLGTVVDAVLGSESNFKLLKFERMQPGYGLDLHRIFKYTDFRSVAGDQTVGNRLDGTSAAAINLTTGNFASPDTYFAAGYAAASAAPGGAYTLFNRETMYGWGNHGTSTQLDLDFTQPSQIATKWSITGGWNPILAAQVFEFRGDKINAVDYSKRSLKNVYQWKPRLFGGDGGFVQALQTISDTADITSDFIKFYFTGPKLHPGVAGTEEDDIIVFRATLTSLSDSISPSWTSQQMVGRADPNYRYSGMSRSFNLSFTIYATDRDEMKPIWRKLNALASYAAPNYDESNIALKGPWMRMTIGDLFVQTPVVLTTIDYTLMGGDTTWEINVERDASMMQVPKQIEVSLAGNIVSNYIPQKNGIMYPLAKQFNGSGKPIKGTDNWVSDFADSVDKPDDLFSSTVNNTLGSNTPTTFGSND